MQRSLSPRSTSTERSLPVNNVRLKVPKHLSYYQLWDHNNVDHSFCLLAFREKPPNVILNGNIFAYGLEEFKTLRQPRDSSLEIETAFTFEFNDEGECTLQLHKPLHDESIENWKKKAWNKFEINISFTDLSEVGSNFSFVDYDLENLSSQTRSAEKSSSLKHVLIASGKCYLSNNYKFDFTFNLAIFSTCFVMTTIPHLEIIHSGILEDLMYVEDDYFYETPKSGFIAMDEELRIRLILDRDPIIETDISIVGIWISGVNNASNFYVWTCCARYFHHFHIKNKVERCKHPFLVIVFDNNLKKPSFYDCCREYCEGNLNESEFNVYQLFYSETFQKSLLYQQFPMKFGEVISRLPLKKCLKIANLSSKSNQETASASDENSDFDENSSLNVSRTEFNEAIKAKEEIIRNLHLKLDNLESRSSNGSYIIKGKRSTSTMTEPSTHFPALSTNAYKQRATEENTELIFEEYQPQENTELIFEDYQPQVFEESITADHLTLAESKYEAVFGGDSTNYIQRSPDSPPNTALPFENAYAQPRQRGVNRKIIETPRYPIRNNSAFDNYSPYDFESAVEESIYPSIAVPTHHYSKSKIRFECSQQFQEFADKYKTIEHRPTYEMSASDFSFRAKEYWKNKT